MASAPTQKQISIVLTSMVVVIASILAISLLNNTRPVVSNNTTSSSTISNYDELYAQPTDYAPLADAPSFDSNDPTYTSSKFEVSFQIPPDLTQTVVESIGNTNCELIKHTRPNGNGVTLSVQIALNDPNCIYGTSLDNGLFNVGNPPQVETLKNYTLQTKDKDYMTVVKQRVLTDNTYRLVAYNTYIIPEFLALNPENKINVIGIYVIANSSATLDTWEKAVGEIASTLHASF